MKIITVDDVDVAMGAVVYGEPTQREIDFINQLNATQANKLTNANRRFNESSVISRHGQYNIEAFNNAKSLLAETGLVIGNDVMYSVPYNMLHKTNNAMSRFINGIPRFGRGVKDQEYNGYATSTEDTTLEDGSNLYYRYGMSGYTDSTPSFVDDEVYYYASSYDDELDDLYKGKKETIRDTIRNAKAFLMSGDDPSKKS